MYVTAFKERIKRKHEMHKRASAAISELLDEHLEHDIFDLNVQVEYNWQALRGSWQDVFDLNVEPSITLKITPKEDQTMSSKFKRFVNMMERTTSDNDHEALVALRKANEMLIGSNMTWTALLEAKQAMAVEAMPAGEKANGADPVSGGDVELDDMFAVLRQNVKGDFRNFIDSVHAQYMTNGSLSPKQRDAIERAYRRTVGG